MKRKQKVRKVLIADNDWDHAEALRTSIQERGIRTHVVHCERAVMQHIHNYRPYNMIVLDLSLSMMDGLKMLRAIRNTDSRVPVTVLTANIEDRRKAALLGATACFSKTDPPYGIGEYIARKVG